jgi:hypothetical protein
MALAFFYPLPCRCGIERGSIASTWFRDTSIILWLSTLPTRVSDNLVSDGQGSLPTINSGTGIGTREQILLAEILRHCDSILETLGGARERIEFLRFDGTSDPLQWIHRYECYFHARQTPKDRRVAYATFHLLDDAQLWYHRFSSDGRPPTWEHFVLLIATRFGPQITLGGSSDAGDIL